MKKYLGVDLHRNFFTVCTRMKARRGTGKAIIALSRKFLGIIYKTRKYDWFSKTFRSSFWRTPGR